MTDVIGFSETRTLACRATAPRSVDSHLGDDERSDMFVEPFDELCAHHGKVLAQRRVDDFHAKCLVSDVFLLCVARDGRPYDDIPRIDDALLQQRRLQSAIPKCLSEYVSQCLYLTPEHRRRSFLLSLRPRRQRVCSLNHHCGVSCRGGHGWCQ